MDRYTGGVEETSQITEDFGSEEEEEEEEDDGFVVDDDIVDGVKVGRTAQVELPAAFSTAQTKKFSANFKIYVEFLVLTTLGQATQSPYYQTAVHGVERRVRAYQDSLITSDAWRPEFKAALDRYPRWSKGRCNERVCAGCRQNRAASFEVVLAAEPEDTEAEPRDKRFSLGSECYKRAKVYHKLVHFRSHMHKHVRNEAEALMTKACLTEDIMKAMQSSGFVKQLYRQTQSLFNEARLQYMPAKGMPVDDDSSDEEGE
ncbi:hypothetical protein BJV82DRAFT_181412 [Fennellomyces sp. T-0311]|nr:hypothetical protein BJV82DRAFT_181412 [Fennellomyces sp. T-0311]